MPKIHPTAVVDSNAEIADTVEIGPLCVVGPNVKMGAGTKLIGQCHIGGYTTIGEDNKIFPFASIGMDAQDYDFKGGKCYVKIGNGNVIRENCTIHCGTKDGTATVIGDGCMLMTNSHVAHNCELGNKVIIVSFGGVSGYVTVGDGAIISGLSGVHQFCRIGRLAMLSGGTMISQDLPPFMIADGRNGTVRSFNKIGLRRSGASRENISAVGDVYKIFYRGGLNAKNALIKIREEVPQVAEVVEFIEFVETSKRGVLQGRNSESRA